MTVKGSTRITGITLILFAIGCIVTFAALSESEQVRAHEASSHSSMETCIGDGVDARILDASEESGPVEFHEGCGWHWCTIWIYVGDRTITERVPCFLCH